MPLADVTNLSRKRAGSMSDTVESRLPISKHVCLDMESSNSGDDLYGQRMTDKVIKHSIDSSSTVAAGQVEGITGADVNVVGIIEGANAAHQVDSVSRDTCFSVPWIPLGSNSCKHNSSTVIAASKNNSQLEISNGDKNLTLPYFNFDQSESIESAKSVNPSKLQPFGLERCTSLKGDNEPNSGASGGYMLKTCSCSFCLKAAYRWSDLHCQDVKGRLSAAKKSKNEALNLFQRISIDKEADTTDQGKFHSTSKLESELFNQWRSLFLHMEESITRERYHLQDNFHALKELREICKVNLEMIDAKPAEHD